MANIKITKKETREIARYLNDTIVNNHISNLTVVNSSTILLTFSFLRRAKLLISLDKNSPYIGLVEEIESIPTIDNGMSMQLRHHVKDGYIYQVEQINDDNIIKIHYKMHKSELELEDKSLIIELIPLKPNLMVLREDQSIVFASHYSDENDERNININQFYTLPDNENHLNICDALTIDEINKAGAKIYEKSLIKRKKEMFEQTFTFIKNKIKLLKRKISILENEIVNGQDGLSYQELGNACFYMPLDELLAMFDEYGKKYKKELSPSENANLCFKLYKKSKNKINEASKQLEIAKADLLYYQHLNDQCQVGQEDDIAQIQQMILPKKNLKPQERKKIKNKGAYVIKLKDCNIYFGKNDIQNDHLTFEIAHYKDTFVHIANYPGAHIIIKTENLQNEHLLIAAELALLLSNKDVGDINYCQVKDVKKTEKLGLVRIKNEKIIHLNKIRPSTKLLLKQAVRTNK